MAWNLPRALLRALFAVVVGDDDPPAVETARGDEFSAAAITAATASTSMPWAGGEANDLVGTGGPLGNATDGTRWDTCLFDRGGAIGCGTDTGLI